MEEIVQAGRNGIAIMWVAVTVVTFVMALVMLMAAAHGNAP
jgi:hypothetical protein